MSRVFLALAASALLVSGVSALPGWNGTQVQNNITASDIPVSLSNFPVLIHPANSLGREGMLP